MFSRFGYLLLCRTPPQQCLNFPSRNLLGGFEGEGFIYWWIISSTERCEDKARSYYRSQETQLWPTR